MSTTLGCAREVEMAASMIAVCCDLSPHTILSWNVMVLTATVMPFHVPVVHQLAHD